MQMYSEAIDELLKASCVYIFMAMNSNHSYKQFLGDLVGIHYLGLLRNM